MTYRLFRLAAALTALVAPATVHAADGAALFSARCAGCHALGPKSSFAGPTLKGVVGRRIASLGDFTYSAALKGKTGAWSAASLGAFLTAPQAFAAGSKMFINVPAADDRTALITYLTGQK